MYREAWWATVHGIAKSQTQLKQLSTSIPGASQVGSAVKNPPANVGDKGSIPGSERSPGGGNGSLLQYSCLGNPMDRGPWWAVVHGAPKGQTRLSP